MVKRWRAGGLETLVVEGDESTVLVPAIAPYAQMRKRLAFIPSASGFKKLGPEKCGFAGMCAIADVRVTTTEEQRRTEWMVTESLADFLDP